MGGYQSISTSISRCGWGLKSADEKRAASLPALDQPTSLDVQQPGPLIDHLLKMPQVQPLPGPSVDKNVPHLTVPHIMPGHLAVLILLVHHY